MRKKRPKRIPNHTPLQQRSVVFWTATVTNRVYSRSCGDSAIEAGAGSYRMPWTVRQRKHNNMKRVWIPKLRSAGTVLRTKDHEYLVELDDYRLSSPEWIDQKSTEPLSKNTGARIIRRTKLEEVIRRAGRVV